MSEYGDFVNNIKPTIEILYFLSGPLVAVAAWIALKQIKLSKSISQKSCTRGALAETAKQIEYFATEIMPRANKISKELNKLGVPASPQIIDLKKPIKKGFISSWLRKTEPIHKDLFELLYRLEATAFYFTDRIGYEDKAFISIGQVFCELVDDLAPLIIISREDDPNGCKYIIDLYDMWHPKLKSSRSIEDIVDELLTKNKKVTAGEPVGTEK